MPKQVASGLMFGGGLSVPIPDVDRTDHLLILGANPLVSNGSLLTAPDMRGRIRAIRERGGKVVVIDPRRSRTAREASEHHFIRPGTDAHLLFAIVNVLIAEGLADPGRLAEHANGAELIAELARAVHARGGRARSAGSRPTRSGAWRASWPPPSGPPSTARIGTTTQRFGTLASWLVDVINYLTGNLDREGGAMFPLAARRAAQLGRATARSARACAIGRWASRVSGRPEVFGELPVVGARRGDHDAGRGPGAGAGHDRRQPARLDARRRRRSRRRSRRSTSWSRVDIYVNETTRHADVILPAPEPLAKAPLRHRALPARGPQRGELLAAGDRPRPRARPQEWEIMLRLAAIAAGQGPDADIEAWDDLVIQTLIGREVALPGSPIEGRDAGRDRRRARRPPRPRAPARLPAPRRPVRRGLRRRPRRA